MESANFIGLFFYLFHLKKTQIVADLCKSSNGFFILFLKSPEQCIISCHKHTAPALHTLISFRSPIQYQLLQQHANCSALTSPGSFQTTTGIVLCSEVTKTCLAKKLKKPMYLVLPDQYNMLVYHGCFGSILWMVIQVQLSRLIIMNFVFLFNPKN